jgi:hypothetical protein
MVRGTMMREVSIGTLMFPFKYTKKNRKLNSFGRTVNIIYLLRASFLLFSCSSFFSFLFFVNTSSGFREEPSASILHHSLFINYLIKAQGEFFLYLKNFLFAVALESEIDLVQMTRHKILKASSSLWISWV